MFRGKISQASLALDRSEHLRSTSAVLLILALHKRCRISELKGFAFPRSTTLPPGYTAPLHPISSDDHGGYASIASGCGLVFILMFAGIRLWNCGRIGHFVDDSVLFAGTVSNAEAESQVKLTLAQGFCILTINSDSHRC